MGYFAKATLIKHTAAYPPAIPGVKKCSIKTKEYSNIFQMFARTILAFTQCQFTLRKYNILNSQGEFAISEEGRSPWARAPSGNNRLSTPLHFQYNKKCGASTLGEQP
jgi:hypothetical protein